MYGCVAINSKVHTYIQLLACASNEVSGSCMYECGILMEIEIDLLATTHAHRKLTFC